MIKKAKKKNHFSKTQKTRGKAVVECLKNKILVTQLTNFKINTFNYEWGRRNFDLLSLYVPYIFTTGYDVIRLKIKTRENAIVDCVDYQIPVN